MSSAMKVMFPHEDQDTLSRNELVGFFNLLRKLSNSIHWYEKWIHYEDTEIWPRQVTLYVIILLTILFSTMVYAMITTKKNPNTSKKGYKRA